MENGENTIKSITPTSCPHCKKDFFVEFEMKPTTLSGLYTQENVNDSKALVLRELKALELDSIQEENAINWITDPSTIFGPNEVELILKSLTENKTK